MTRPTLLVATDTYRPERNGAAIVTERAVRGLVQRGWAVHLVAPRAQDDAPVHDGATHERLPSVGLPFYGSVRVAVSGLRALRTTIAHRRPDVVWSATEFRVGRAAQLAARALDLPTVSSYHTDFARYASAYGTGAIAQPVRAFLSRFHRRSALVLAPSRAACEELMTTGVPSPRLWGRTVDARAFRPDRRDEQWRLLHGASTRTTFLCVSRLAREKGIDRVIDGYALAQARLPADSTQLLIVGDGPLEGALRQRAAARLAAVGAPADAIRFLGPRDRDRDLPMIYASADAFVFASTTETLGLVILEAMASGLPVVAPRIGGIADHLIDGANGLATGSDLVEGLARAMVQLALTPVLRRALGAAARLTAESVDEARELDRLDRALRALRRPALASAA